MSIRNQLRTAKGILAGMTGALLAKEVRATIASFEKPELQDAPAFPDISGRWLTVAQVKEHFGPDYATTPVVIEQVISVFIGNLVRKTIEEVGLDVRVLTPQQAMDVMSVTAHAEQSALVRMTTN